jgi:hypothetical protein
MRRLKSITFLFAFAFMLSNASAVDSVTPESKAITPSTIEIFQPPSAGLTGSLERELECENVGVVSFDLVIKVPVDYKAPKAHVFQLRLSDDQNKRPVSILPEVPKTCETTFRQASPKVFKANQIYQFTVLFPVKAAAAGPFTGVLWIDSGGEKMSSPVTVTATRSAKQPVLPLLNGLNPKRGKDYSPEVLMLGFVIPFVFGVVVWLIVAFPIPNKTLTADVTPDISSSWISVIAALLPVANSFATIPALSTAGFVYLTSAQHTIISISYTALWIGGWLIFVITSRPTSAKNERKNWAWILGLRNALAVSSLVGQLLQVLILLLEAYRSSILPASSVGLLMTIIVALIFLVAGYGILKGQEDVTAGKTSAFL